MRWRRLVPALRAECRPPSGVSCGLHLGHISPDLGSCTQVASLMVSGDLLDARAALRTSCSFELLVLLAVVGNAELLRLVPWG